jgi:hypothetical protein
VIPAIVPSYSLRPYDELYPDGPASVPRSIGKPPLIHSERAGDCCGDKEKPDIQPELLCYFRDYIVPPSSQDL